jgi:ethanolamine utilization protein EutA (predicted chaperonin)
VAACIITWIATSGVAVMMALTALAMAVARNEIFAELQRQQPDFDFQGVSQRDLAIAVVLVACVVMLWCIAAAVLAVLAMRGMAWARIALVVSAIAAGVASLIGMFANPLLVVVVICTAVVAGLLLRRNVGEWYRLRR